MIRPNNLSAAAERFLDVKRAQKRRSVTMRDYEYQLRRFIASSSNSLDYDTLEWDVIRYFAEIPDTSPARYNKPYQNLHAFFNFLVRHSWLTANPMDVNELKKRRDDGEYRAVPLAEIHRFISLLDNKTRVASVTLTVSMVMLDCGIRPKELLALPKTALDIQRSVLRVDAAVAKTHRSRLLFLSQPCVKQLEVFQNTAWGIKGQYLIPNQYGNQMTTTYVDRYFVKASRITGVKLTPYQLRHSFATYYLRAGGDLFTLQQQMGHSDVRQTKRYTALDDEFICRQHESFSPLSSVLP